MRPAFSSHVTICNRTPHLSTSLPRKCHGVPFLPSSFLPPSFLRPPGGRTSGGLCGETASRTHPQLSPLAKHFIVVLFEEIFAVRGAISAVLVVDEVRACGVQRGQEREEGENQTALATQFSLETLPSERLVAA